jgi:large repetitive protein
MKNFLFSLLTVSFIISLSAQKVDYDNASKSFIGFNLGGTWNTTDVKYKLGAGWGITLGRSFNYNYGKIVSFDVRARYLSGNWYGKDLSSSSLNDYNGTALAAYKDKEYIHNFKSKTRRLALELAVHLNGLTQRTGLDPYIFAGIGITYNRTYGNLLKIDSLTNYQYPDDLNSLDATYESVLDGYDTSKFMINTMPSLGFGLGYNIGKNTTIGIEHKTTFTQKDIFDGLSSTSPRTKNDLYHYTSLYIQVRLNTKPSERTPPNTANPVVRCPKPTIRISNSSTSNFVSTSPQFSIKAAISNVTSMSNITFFNSSNNQLPFNYNSSSNQFNSSVILNPGMNTFTLTANNDCGVEQKTITIQYKDCIDPSLTFINPSSERTIVRVPSFTFSAIINGFQNTQGILVYQNGILLNNISFNPSTLVLQASVILQPGLNEFIVTLTNNCGSTSSNTSVTYESCARPTITSTNPQNNALVTLSALVFKARIENITSKENIVAKLNGNPVSTTYNSNTKIADLRLQLTPGTNIISLTATNNCGTSSETIIINYNDCKAPIISIIGRDNTFSVAPYTLSANISNMASKEGITVTQNGAPQNFTFSNGKLNSNINLQAGENKLIVSAVKSCGTDSKTIIINFNDCKAPIISIIGRNNTLSAAPYTLTANITNMASKEGISVTQNGTPIDFTFTNGELKSNLNLKLGKNKFVINAIKSCGRDSKILVITYKKPKPIELPSDKKEGEKEIKKPDGTPKGKDGGR